MEGSRKVSEGRKVSIESNTTHWASATLPAIERVVNAISAKPCAFNRLHPFVDVFLSDFTDSRELLDVSD
jgi:hypothetical protein